MGWAYEFFYEKTLEEMRTLFNQWGPWEWNLGDSAWYGDYLSCVPVSDVRIRIHEWGYEHGKPRKYSSLMQIIQHPSVQRSGASRVTLDQVFFDLLNRLPVQGLKEIEWYD